MPQHLKGGTVPRRLRLKMPGWRGGVFDLRPGKADKATYRAWRVLLEAAYREGFFDVLDAVSSGDLSLQKAYQLSITGGAGLAAVRAHLEELAAKRAQAALAGDFPAWLDEFERQRPREAADLQYRKIRMASEGFMDSIVEQQRAEGHAAFGRGDITREHWTHAALLIHIADYIKERHAEARKRLEAQWAQMDEPPTPAEQKEILKRDEGKKTVTANRRVNAVAAFSQWLLESGRIDEDPAVGARMTSAKEQLLREDDHRPIMPDDLRGLLHWSRIIDQELARRDGLEATTLFWTWLALSGATTWTEGVRVRPEDVRIDDADGDGAVPVKVLGTKAAARRRFVPIPLELAKRLIATGEANGGGPRRRVFRFTTTNGRKQWARIMRRIEKEDPELSLRLDGATPYALRHTFATNALLNGVTIKEVKDLLGHKSLETTSRYLDWVPSSRRRLMNAAATLDIL